MPRSDDGEFELVLGNKQLLSVFFIVIVLLGVFFTMGYIVGRNTSPEAMAEMAALPGQPLVVEAEPSAATSDTQQTASSPPPETKPAPSASDEAPAAEPASAPPASKPAKPKPAPPRRTAPPPPTASASSEPAPGQTFLQVAATSRAEAEVLLDVLRKRDFTGRLAPVPGQDLFRVLVGPFENNDSLSKARSDLQSAGIKPFIRRY